MPVRAGDNVVQIDKAKRVFTSNKDASRSRRRPMKVKRGRTQLNGKLYTVAKAQFDRQCPAVATGPTGSVVR